MTIEEEVIRDTQKEIKEMKRLGLSPEEYYKQKGIKYMTAKEFKEKHNIDKFVTYEKFKKDN